MSFRSQGEAVRSAYSEITGSMFSGPIKLEVEVRQKIGDKLLEWFKAGLWTIKSERCNQGEGLIAYIGADPKKAMKCNVIDNFLCRDKATEVKKEKVGTSVVSPLETIKQALDMGLITPEQAAAKVMELIA